MKKLTWDRALVRVMRLNGRAMRLKEIAEKAAELKGTDVKTAYGNVAAIIGYDQKDNRGRFDKIARGMYRRVA